jgi:protein arginine N-methyltransferase 1
VSDVIDEHRLYLMDGPRIDAYQRAIAETVRPGDVVIDLGAGSGILGLLACRAGASKVYAIESTSLIELTRQIADTNGFADRIEHLQTHSQLAELGRCADVVVCDQVGRFGFDAGVLQFLADASRRMLKPGGRVIPSRLELWVAPVEVPKRSAHVHFWDVPVVGFDMSPARRIARNSGYPVRLKPKHLLGDGVLLAQVDARVDDAFSGFCSTRVERAGHLHGVGGWFVGELAPGIHFTNSPTSPERIIRRNVFLPIDQPLEVKAGEVVDVRMKIIPQEWIVTWWIKVRPKAGAEPRASFCNSTFHGILISRDDLRRTRPDSIPRLTSHGEARRTVLELCDGARSLADVELQLQARYPKLFPSLSHAAVFVAEVVTRYAE